MANFFRITHTGGSSTTVNVDLIESISLKEKILTIHSAGRKIELTFETLEGAKEIYENLYYAANGYNYDDDDEDDEDDELIKKPNEELILSQRVNELLDLLNEKNKEIEKLKSEKKGFINKIKSIL